MAEPTPRLKRLSLVARHSPTRAGFEPPPPPQQTTPTRSRRPQSMYADLASPASASSSISGFTSSHHSAGSVDLASPSKSRPSYLSHESESPSKSRLSYVASKRESASSASSEGSVSTPPSEATPRMARHQGKRSSISYSPAAARSSLERSSLDRAERRSSLGILLEGAERAPEAPLTLAEKHSDLLHAIAASERRVTELRTALLAEETALAGLRGQFASAVAAEHALDSSRRAKSPPPAPSPSVPRAKSPPPDASTSAAQAPANSGSRHPMSRPEQLDADSLGVGALWSAMAQDAEETIQEGKRFWGQLVRSVTSDARPGGKLDLSGIRTMLPSIPALLPEPAPSARPKDVRLKRASLSLSPAQSPKLPQAGSSGSEIGLSRSTSRASATSATSATSAKSVASAAPQTYPPRAHESLIDMDDAHVQLHPPTAPGTPRTPPRDLVLDGVMW